MPTKRIDLGKPTFIANGKTYRIGERLSLDRWIEFEKLQPKLGFGKDFQSIYNALETSIRLGNNGKGIEAWNVILNLKESVKDHLENRMDTALHICALFINREKDEDVRTVNKELIEEKIDDWRKEGYDALDFFHLAANLVSGFVDVLLKTSPDILPISRKDEKKK